MKRIVVDVMGSDKGPEVLLEGVRSFISKHDDVKVTIVGSKEVLDSIKNEYDTVESNDVLKMDDGALSVMRKKGASMNLAMDEVLNSRADAIVSAGGTAGFITSATVKLRLIEGVERAALITPFPKSDGGKVIVLDIGANNEVNASHLVSFAKMGSVFAKTYLNKKDLNVYLLSNGAEENKGSPASKEAHKMLKEMNFEGFKGNMEARYVTSKDADLVVCGGYEGNVFLKGMEGAVNLVKGILKKSFTKSLKTKLGYLLIKKSLNEEMNTVNYKNYGGALLLGVNGIAVKAHGSSDAYSFEQALDLAYRLVKDDVLNNMKKEFVK